MSCRPLNFSSFANCHYIPASPVSLCCCNPFFKASGSSVFLLTFGLPDGCSLYYMSCMACMWSSSFNWNVESKFPVISKTLTDKQSESDTASLVPSAENDMPFSLEVLRSHVRGRSTFWDVSRSQSTTPPCLLTTATLGAASKTAAHWVADLSVLKPGRVFINWPSKLKTSTVPSSSMTSKLSLQKMLLTIQVSHCWTQKISLFTLYILSFSCSNEDFEEPKTSKVFPSHAYILRLFFRKKPSSEALVTSNCLSPDRLHTMTAKGLRVSTCRWSDEKCISWTLSVSKVITSPLVTSHNMPRPAAVASWLLSGLKATCKHRAVTSNFWICVPLATSQIIAKVAEAVAKSRPLGEKLRCWTE